MGGMRLIVLGGTRFIGDRIVRATQRRGDEVTIVHRGSTEPADHPDQPTAGDDALVGRGTHIHIDRADFAAMAAQVRALRPDAVIDTCATDPSRRGLRAAVSARGPGHLAVQHGRVPGVRAAARR